MAGDKTTEEMVKPKRQKTGGRQKGTPNKTTTEVRTLFQKHGIELVRRLMSLSRSNNKEIALRATAEALNRGYGKPPVALDIVQRDPDEMSNIDFARRLMFFLYVQVRAAIQECPELAQVPRATLLQIALDQALEDPSLLGAENETPAAPGVLGVDDGGLGAENSARDESQEGQTPDEAAAENSATPETPSEASPEGPSQTTGDAGLLGEQRWPGNRRENDY